MTWVALAGLTSIFIALCFALRRGALVFWGPVSSRSTGVEGARRLGKKTRDALDAASTLLQ